MPPSRQQALPPNTEITLGVLNAVHEDSAVTQRKVANELGVALGLVNAYLKRCVNKGLIKVRAVPANRYAYYLTPKGFSEKSRLTAEFLGQSFSLFRQARTQYSEIFSDCAARGWQRIALCGVSDLAEIAVLCAQDTGLTLVGAVDEAHGPAFLGLPVVKAPHDLPEADAYVITALKDAQEVHARAQTWTKPERVLAPRLLGLDPRR
ncbi:MAG: winged helix-turn-helix transcriptional regulator [Rhodospirillales bacterium]|nr:winged helix-turn-helix transcriptional regulator [Rhodospirillales bacterium]